MTMIIECSIPPPPQPNWERKVDDETGLEYFEHSLTGNTDYDAGNYIRTT